jgi:hypothetical protein
MIQLFATWTFILIKITIFWDVMLRNLEHSYEHLKEPTASIFRV